MGALWHHFSVNGRTKPLLDWKRLNESLLCDLNFKLISSDSKLFRLLKIFESINKISVHESLHKSVGEKSLEMNKSWFDFNLWNNNAIEE